MKNIISTLSWLEPFSLFYFFIDSTSAPTKDEVVRLFGERDTLPDEHEEEEKKKCRVEQRQKHKKWHILRDLSL